MKKILLILVLVSFVFPFFVQAETKKTKTETKPVKILIAPGHDNEIWGAQYGNLKEADMNLVLAKQIYDILKKDKRFKVYITRDKKGYVKEFADYFNKQKDEIISFKEKAKAAIQEKISKGDFVEFRGVPHNAALSETSIKLYGVNKWANENNIDAVIHVHFNDVPRAGKWDKDEYKGFAVYRPEEQLQNSKSSLPLAKNIFKQLATKYITSNFPKEEGGIVFDQQLIALGASNTLNPNTRSILIEYGYIYRFGNSTSRHKAYKSMAQLTAKGIVKDFFTK